MIECSACSKQLADIILDATRPLSGPSIIITASCPYCGDESVPLEVGCRYYLYGVSVENEEALDGFDPITIIASRKTTPNGEYLEIKKC